MTRYIVDLYYIGYKTNLSVNNCTLSGVVHMLTELQVFYYGGYNVHLVGGHKT